MVYYLSDQVQLLPHLLLGRGGGGGGQMEWGRGEDMLGEVGIDQVRLRLFVCVLGKVGGSRGEGTESTEGKAGY